MEPQFVLLKSDLLDSASFHPDEDRIRLKFKSNGAMYDYTPRPDNPPESMQVIFISLISAESAGRYFLTAMKHNKQLLTKKVTDKPPEAGIDVCPKCGQTITLFDHDTACSYVTKGEHIGNQR